MRRSALWFILSAATLVAPAAARADSVTIGAAADNTLYESSTGALSNGAGPTMFAGRTAQASNSRRRAVLRFDVAAAVPAGSTIQSVTLTLMMSQASSPAADNLALRPVTASWGEGTSNAGSPGGAGAPSTTNDATWKHRFFSATNWAALGGDFSAVSSATASVGAEGPYTWGSTPGMVANVQSWLDTPGNNFGWLILGNEATGGTAKRFDTREATLPEARPALTIEYQIATPARQATWGRLKDLYR